MPNEGTLIKKIVEATNSQNITTRSAQLVFYMLKDS